MFSLFCLILPNLCRCVWKIRILYDEIFVEAIFLGGSERKMNYKKEVWDLNVPHFFCLLFAFCKAIAYRTIINRHLYILSESANGICISTGRVCIRGLVYVFCFTFSALLYHYFLAIMNINALLWFAIEFYSLQVEPRVVVIVLACRWGLYSCWLFSLERNV